MTREPEDHWDSTIRHWVRQNLSFDAGDLTIWLSGHSS
jgi:hypothetical protein